MSQPFKDYDPANLRALSDWLDGVDDKTVIADATEDLRRIADTIEDAPSPVAPFPAWRAF